MLIEEKTKQISEHLKILLGRFGKKDDSQKWRMKEKLVNKKTYMSLIETLSTTSFFFFKVSALKESNLKEFANYFKVTSSERE